MRTDVTGIVWFVFAVGEPFVNERADGNLASRYTGASAASTVVATDSLAAFFAKFVLPIREDGQGVSTAVRIAKLTFRKLRIADNVSVVHAIDHAARGAVEVHAYLKRFAAIAIATNLFRTALVVGQGISNAFTLQANSVRGQTRIVVGGLARLPIVDNPQPIGPGFQRWRAEPAGFARLGCKIFTGNAIDQAGFGRAQAEFTGR